MVNSAKRSSITHQRLYTYETDTLHRSHTLSNSYSNKL